jgi:hypothetical protein
LTPKKQVWPIAHRLFATVPLSCAAMASQAKDPLQDAVEQACAGKCTSLYTFLERHGALPGPRPNFKLAVAAAGALVAKGARGLNVLRQLQLMTPSVAAANTSSEYLPVVGVVGVGCQAARGASETIANVLLALQPFAEDPRTHVRGAVLHALREVLDAHTDDAVESLKSWTDGYLQACAALDAMAEPLVMQHLKQPDRIVQRLDESFDLLDRAPRSHERSQGYRALMRAIGATPAVVGRRFPVEVGKWLLQRAGTQNPELREAIASTIHKMRGAGVRHGDVEQAERALEASRPAPRDPRSYVGPTRGRGTKAKKRGAQR